MEIGANWVQHPSMKHAKDIPLDNMVKEAGLNLVHDDYEDYIFRYKGKNVTDKASKASNNFEDILDKSVGTMERKVGKKEPDINYRAAFALLDWRPKHPIEKAAEFYYFDFEFADEPEDTGLKNNAHVFKDHGDDDLFIADKRGFCKSFET